MNAQAKNSQEYYDWLSKFEKRNTSDDTFTPPAVYDVVRNLLNFLAFTLFLYVLGGFIAQIRWW